MSSQIDTIVNAYKALSKIPTIASGRLNNLGNKISSVQSIRNIDKQKNSKYVNNYLLDDNLNVISKADYGVDIGDELLSAVSPKETFKAVIREEKDSKDAKKQYLEIWRQSAGLTNCIDLTALDVHGDVYADIEFGSLDWSPDETAVVYIAERKLKKSEPYIKRTKIEDGTKSGGGEPLTKKGEEYLYKQDWGEQLVGKHFSVVVMCKIESETISVLEGFPESYCPGQVCFGPEGKSVVGVAWETQPRRLGLMFCTNRPSFIFDLTLYGQLTKLSDEGFAVRSPRLRSNGDVIWLQRKAVGPHHACHALVIRKRGQSEISPIIDIVQTEIPTAQGKPFYGLYNQSLPKNCFTKDSSRIVFSTPSVYDVKTYTIDIDNIEQNVNCSPMAHDSVLPEPPVHGEKPTPEEILAPENSGEVTTEQNLVVVDQTDAAPPPEVDPDMLTTPGESTDDTPDFGKEIHENLTKLWLPLLKKGMNKEAKDKIHKEYLVPTNCRLLQAPKLNVEISAAVPDMVRNWDKNLAVMQQQLGHGISAVNRAMDILIKGKDADKIQAMTHLSNGCRILCDLHASPTQSRIKLVTPSSDKTFLQVIQDAERVDTVFGSKLAEKIKGAKTIEKQGLQIKKPTPKSSTSVQPSTSRAGYSGNWTAHPRYTSNRGGGGRRGARRQPAQYTRRTYPAKSSTTTKTRAQAP